MRTVIVIVSVLVVVLGALGVWLGPQMVEKVRERMPQQDGTLVRLEKPQRGDLVERIQAPGEIEPKTNVEISARVSARIIDLPFDEGDEVKAGDVVLRLESKDLDSSLLAAQARRAADAARIDVANARLEGQGAGITGSEAALREARLNLERQRELLKSRDTSQSVIDSAEARVEQLKANLAGQRSSLVADKLNLQVMEHNLEVADAEIDRAMEQVSYTTITSPIDGVVTRLNAEVGELAMTGTMNNAGTIILEIADLSQMLLIAQVDEADVGGLAKGQHAIVRINAYRDREFEGVVDFISLSSSRANDGSKYYRTEILIDTQGEQIYSGLTADVEIETRRHEEVVKVPSQAVLARSVDDLPINIREDNPDVDMTKTFATVMYRFVDGKALVTPVTIGASDLTHTVILSGISEDDEIIVGPYKVLENLTHEKGVKDERVDAEEKAEKERKKQKKENQKKDAETAKAQTPGG